MKWTVRFMVVLATVVFLMSSGFAFAEAPFHIGIMTGTVSQQEDELRGAEKMMETYGNEAQGGMISMSHTRTTSCRRWKLL